MYVVEFIFVPNKVKIIKIDLTGKFQKEVTIIVLALSIQN